MTSPRVASYIVFIRYRNSENKSVPFFTLGYDKEQLMEAIVEPYNEGSDLFYNGEKVKHSSIEKIHIFGCSVEQAKDIELPKGKSIYDYADADELIRIFNQKGSPQILGTCEQFLLKLNTINRPPQPLIGTDGFGERKNAKSIFIVHGRDDASAYKLKDHLVKKGINAEMFEDFKERIAGNTTVIEELIKIKDQISYAFVIASADDRGNLSDDIEDYINGLVKGKSTVDPESVCSILDQLNCRARQNVLFEYGLFLGVLGREKVECIWDKKIGEEPSDIEGVLNIHYDTSIRQAFPDIDAKIDKIK